MGSASNGYWEPITASVDWCEENYAVTQYVAEFLNTLSSVPIFTLGVWALRQGLSRGDTPPYLLACGAMMIIGIGSMAFHGTLTRLGQYLDEIPMLWGVLAFMLVGLVDRPYRGIPLKTAAVLIAWGTAATVVYFWLGFEAFVVMYTVTVLATIATTWVQTGRSRSTSRRSQHRNYAVASAGVYSFGFLFLWLPEQYFCGNRLHRTEPSVIQSLHFHALFHLTSSIGPYLFLCLTALMHADDHGKDTRVAWVRPTEVACLTP
eukprot:Sspe_Gene.53854::Locus_29744_Transcript_1_1_Confidence_1.000_Length_2085::g.53854::m.53854/K04711/ACER3, YDC1; dihydroceramidase